MPRPKTEDQTTLRNRPIQIKFSEKEMEPLENAASLAKCTTPTLVRRLVEEYLESLEGVYSIQVKGHTFHLTSAELRTLKKQIDGLIANNLDKILEDK